MLNETPHAAFLCAGAPPATEVRLLAIRPGRTSPQRRRLLQLDSPPAQKGALGTPEGITVDILVLYPDRTMAAPQGLLQVLQSSSLLPAMLLAGGFEDAGLLGEPKISLKEWTPASEPEIDWPDPPLAPAPPPPPPPGDVTTNDTARDVVQWVGLAVGLFALLIVGE